MDFHGAIEDYSKAIENLETSLSSKSEDTFYKSFYEEKTFVYQCRSRMFIEIKEYKKAYKDLFNALEIADTSKEKDEINKLIDDIKPKIKSRRTLCLRYWGKRIDHSGTYTTIRFTSFWIAIFPVFWVFLYYLPIELILPGSIVIASLASLMFSGRALALDNRLYEHMKSKKMIKITSKRVFFRGLSIFIGGLIGGVYTAFIFS
jgi:tetratricopeptide (TPR) repeat protein